MRKVFISVIVVFLCAQLASADYADPPGWDTNPYFTHQSWSFDTQQANPMAPDDGVISPGSPKFNIAPGATWVDDLGMVFDPYTQQYLGTRQGGWRVDGPSGTPDVEMEEWFTIDIPNIKRDLIKEVWIELTFMCANQTHAAGIVNDVDLQIYADGNVGDDNFKFAYHGSTELPVGASMSGEIWVRSASTFSFFPQPGDETIVLRGWMEDGQYVILDQIDVDTRCIPEPATLGLLGIGSLALIRRRKNR